MLARLLSIVLTVALLWGGALWPSTAHARDAGAPHSVEVLQLDDVAGTSDSKTGDGSGKANPEGAHHHCTIAVEAESPTIEPVAPIDRESLIPGLVTILGSRAQAPPIEPPAT